MVFKGRSFINLNYSFLSMLVFHSKLDFVLFASINNCCRWFMDELFSGRNWMMFHIWNLILRFSRCSKTQDSTDTIRNYMYITKALLRPLQEPLMEPRSQLDHLKCRLMKPVLQQPHKFLAKEKGGLKRQLLRILNSGLILSPSFKVLFGREMSLSLMWRRNGSIYLRKFNCISVVRVGMVELCFTISSSWIILQEKTLWTYLTTFTEAWLRFHTKFKLNLIKCTIEFFIMDLSSV